MHNLLSSNRKEVTKVIKKEKKSPTLYLTDYDLLIPYDLWQAHYQILLTVSQKEFIKSNVNSNLLIKM